MKKKLFILAWLGAFTVLMAPFATAIASDVSDALYSATIRISNNGTAATNVFTTCNISTQNLIDGGYINQSCNNTALRTNAGADTAYMMGVTSDNRTCIYIPSIGQNQNLDYTLYMGGTTNMSGDLRYFPAAGGMTAADNTSLELGDNFTVEQAGWVDTSYSANKSLIEKGNAFRVYILDESIAVAAGPSDNESYIAGDNNNIAVYGVNWQAQTFTTPSENISLTDIEIYAERTGSPGTVTASIRATSSSLPSGADLTSGTVDGNTFDTSPAWETIDIGDCSLNATTEYALVIRATGGDASNYIYWRQDSSGAYADGQSAESTDSGGTWAANTGRDMLFVVNFLDDNLAATGVSSGDIVVRASANTTHYTLHIDGVLEDSAALTAGVSDTSENWTYYRNMGGYWHYTRIWVDGVLRQDIIWENSTTFADQSGNSHNATPTFRVTSSDADVSAEMLTFTPISPSEAEDWTLTEAGTMVTNTTATAPTGMWGELSLTSLPGAGIPNAVLDDQGLPRALFWFPAAFLVIVLVGLLIGKFSLLAQMIVMTALIFLAAGAILAPWLGFIFLVDSLAVVVGASQLGAT